MSDFGGTDIGLSYDGIAPHYDRTRQIPREVTEDVRDACVTLMGVEQGCPVYEPGTGTGLFLLPWYDAGHPVLGIDISEAMLTQARARMARGLFQIGDAAHPPPEAGGAGVALTSGLLHVVPDWKQVLEATLAALAPGGVLCCIFGRQETPFHNPLFDQFGESYQKGLAGAGYRVDPPGASEPQIREFLLELAGREGMTGDEHTRAVLTRRWFRNLTFAETIENLRNRVYSWQQQIAKPEHDAILNAAISREAPPEARWPQITEKRVYRLSVVYLRRPRARALAQ